MMSCRSVRRVSVVLAWLVFASVCAAAERPAASQPASLRDFIDRVEVAKAQMPKIIEAAEAAAARTAAHPESLVNLTYSLQSSFGEELLNRSGGEALQLAMCQSLNGYEAVEPRVAGLPHLAHCTRAEKSEDLVRTQLLSGCWRHCSRV